ncbi:MAG: cyclic nucleotide-binding/CBS domain-containing protein [Nitrososphaerales archaeon]
MVQVQDLMTKHVVTIGQDKTAHDAAKIMEANDIGCLVVVKDGNPVGIITERDLVRRVCAKNQRSEDVPLNSIISRPVVSVSPESSVVEAARTMSYKKIRRLLVVRDQKPLGIITATDLARHLRWGKTPKEIMDDILKAIEREA